MDLAQDTRSEHLRIARGVLQGRVALQRTKPTGLCRTRGKRPGRQGRGQATAVAFAQAGARAVYLTARDAAAPAETADLFHEANPQTHCAQNVCDVTDAAQVEAAVADCVDRFGAIDVADANAGYLGPWVKIGESDPDGWWWNW